MIIVSISRAHHNHKQLTFINIVKINKIEVKRMNIKRNITTTHCKTSV